jgi:hypothetical protein
MRLASKQAKAVFNFTTAIYCWLELKIDDFASFCVYSRLSILALHTELVPHEAFTKQVPAQVLYLFVSIQPRQKRAVAEKISDSLQRPYPTDKIPLPQLYVKWASK